MEHLLATVKTTHAVYHVFHTLTNFWKVLSSKFDYGKHPYGDKEDLTKTTKLKRYGQWLAQPMTPQHVFRSPSHTKKIPRNGNACKKESSPQVKYEHQRHSPTKNTRHLHYISTTPITYHLWFFKCSIKNLCWICTWHWLASRNWWNMTK